MFEAVFLYGNQYNHYVLDDAHDVLEVMGIDPTHRDYYVLWERIDAGERTEWGWWTVCPMREAEDLQEGNVVDVNRILEHYGEHLSEYDFEYGVVDSVTTDADGSVSLVVDDLNIVVEHDLLVGVIEEVATS